MRPFRDVKQYTEKSVVFFLGLTVTFFGFAGFNKQANTRPVKPPSVRLAGFPERGIWGGGKTWPASLLFFDPAKIWIFEF